MRCTNTTCPCHKPKQHRAATASAGVLSTVFLILLPGFFASGGFSWARDGTFQLKLATTVEITAAFNAWEAIYNRDFRPFDTLTTTGQLPDFANLPADVRNRFMRPFSEYLAQLTPAERTALQPLFVTIAGIFNPGE
jgi:hypothetical protein